MGTFYHILKDNKSVGMPRNIIFYDTETYPIELSNGYTEQRLKLGVACFVRRAFKEHKQKEEIIVFHKPEEFYNFVDQYTDKNRPLYIFAHNQHFDFSVVNGLQMFKNNGWEITKFIIDSKIFMITYVRNKVKIIFVDTYNIFPISLKELGEQLEIPKLEIEFESCNNKDLEIYCKQDVKIIKEGILQMLDFLDSNQLCYFKPTIASIAFNTFRHKFMNRDIYIHANKKAIRLERLSYRGGRCDCYQLGEYKNDIFYLLDINAMYAYILRNKKLPYKLVTVLKYPTLKDIDKNIVDHDLIIAANITTDEPFIALKRKKLIFPIGTFNVCLTTPEIKYLLNIGKINEVYQINIYESAVLFDKFVDYFHKIKVDQTSKYSLFIKKRAKRIMNSLYGRFGLSIEPYKSLPNHKTNEDNINRYYDGDLHRWKYQITLGNKTYEKKDKREGKDSLVAIPTFVTAYARMLIYSYIELAGLENTYYTDTDSLIVNQTGYDNLMPYIHPTKLGWLKEEMRADYIKINNVKNYQIGYKRKLKGIKQNAQSDDGFTFTQENFLSLKGMLREQLTGSAYTKKIQKRLLAQYDKGVVGSGGKIAPLSLNDTPINPLELV